MTAIGLSIKKGINYLYKWNKSVYFAPAKRKGSLAEWLGAGLQNR